jgi:starch synthase
VLFRSIETYRNKEVWERIQQNAMQADFSWDNVALKYIDLYNKASYFKKEKLLEKTL